MPQQETKSSTKQLAPTDPILDPENLLKTGFAQKGLASKTKKRNNKPQSAIQKSVSQEATDANSFAFWDGTTDSGEDPAVHRLAKSITQLTLGQVTTSEVDDATKLLEKARQKLQGIQNIPSQRVNDLEAAIR